MTEIGELPLRELEVKLGAREIRESGTHPTYPERRAPTEIIDHGHENAAHIRRPGGPFPPPSPASQPKRVRDEEHDRQRQPKFLRENGGRINPADRQPTGLGR